MTTTTYIEYEYPGFFFTENESKKVADRDPQRDAAGAPESAFAFSYYEIVSAEADGVELKSSPRNKSKRYLIGAELLSIADVEALPGDHDILLSNMRGNGWDPIARMRTGNFQPYNSDRDEVIQIG